jgi:hypothetical protein
LVEANDDDVHTHTHTNYLDILQAVVLIDSSTGGGDVGEHVSVDNPVRSPIRSHTLAYQKVYIPLEA